MAEKRRRNQPHFSCNFRFKRHCQTVGAAKTMANCQDGCGQSWYPIRQISEFHLGVRKEKFKRDLATAKQTLVEKTEQCEAIVSVDIDAQIADCDARLGRLKAELDAVRTQLTQLNDKEKPNG